MHKLVLILTLVLFSPFLTSCRTAQNIINTPINLVNRLTPGGIPNLPRLRIPGLGAGPVKTIR